jgi:competence protein ComEA
MKKIGILATMLFFVVAGGFAAHAAAQKGLEPAGVINVNTATEDQLKMLPLINDDLAKAIISYRDSNGPFDNLDQLKNVKGMSDERFNEISPWLVLKGQTTFAPDLYNSGTPGPVY